MWSECSLRAPWRWPCKGRNICRSWRMKNIKWKYSAFRWCVICELLIKLTSVTYSVVFFLWWRAPQQMLRTHHSLKALCASLWWRWAVFYQILQVMEHQWNEIDRGKPTTRRKICPSATLSTTNPTWTDPGSNPGLRSGRPATNRLSHGTT
jgi:hypothetical protein